MGTFSCTDWQARPGCRSFPATKPLTQGSFAGGQKNYIEKTFYGTLCANLYGVATMSRMLQSVGL